MNFETAVAEVQQILGWRSDRATEIQSALRYAQAQRELPNKTFPWFLKQTLTLTTVVGQVTYAIPDAYIQDSEERDGNLYLFTGTAQQSRPVFLAKKSYKDLLAKYLGVWPADPRDSTSDVVNPGKPEEYTLDSTNLYIYRIPDAIYTLHWDCWAHDTVLAPTIENQWLRWAPWVLIGEAAAKLGADLRNSSAVEEAKAILDRANSDLFIATIHRQEAGRRRSMGSRL